MRVLVLGGGPDREREVSLAGAQQVAAALREAGHETVEREIGPDDPSPLDEPCDVVFPVLHGPFGEGGPLQAMLAERDLRFVGCRAAAARLGMDKVRTKQLATARGVPTPPWQTLDADAALTLDPPLVIKPADEGSSFGVFICRDADQIADARRQLHPRYPTLLAERFITGRELTVGLLDGEPLPVIEIVPRGGFYDYEAKYSRDDTDYRFEIDLPEATLAQLQADARRVYEAIGARHLSRVDFLVDRAGRHWMLEINTMPGFTTHSLLPMAARRAGLTMPALCDRLARHAVARD